MEEVKVPFYKKIANKAMEYPRITLSIFALVVVMVLVYYYAGIQYISGKMEKIINLETKMKDLIQSINDKQLNNLGK